MYYGFESGFEFWWIFPLLCFGMMVFCMFFMSRPGMGCCGFGWRRDARGPDPQRPETQMRNINAAGGKNPPSLTPRPDDDGR